MFSGRCTQVVLETLNDSFSLQRIHIELTKNSMKKDLLVSLIILVNCEISVRVPITYAIQQQKMLEG